jgi:hypothetical protein
MPLLLSCVFCPFYGWSECLLKVQTFNLFKTLSNKFCFEFLHISLVASFTWYIHLFETTFFLGRRLVNPQDPFLIMESYSNFIAT